MNRIYNVIWSKTKKCYVVVSEIVKSSGGKVKSLHTGKTYTHMSTVMAVAALLAGVNITSVNAAAIMIDGVNAGYATAQNGGNKWSYLYNYNNPGNMNALDGSATTGYYSGSALNGISIGHNTKIQESSDPTYYSGVAIGDYAQATGGLSFSLGNYAQSTKPSAMAIGTASLSSGFNSLAMMRQSAATGNFSTAIGTTSWASGTGSFALGYSAQSKGDQSIAIGAAEPITVPGSGNEPSAAYNGTTNTVTEGARSLAFGTKARTTAAATDSMAFGSNAKTKAANAVAMGNSSRATGTDSFAFGNTASAAGTNAIAMGRTAQASKANAIALGGQAQALEANALAIGSTAAASKAGTMAIGTASKASSNNSTAIGNGAEVTGENSMALGSGAKISSNNSIALGAGTEFNDPLVSTYAAFTNEMNPAEAGVVAVGNSSTPRRIVNVAGGQNDNDAATIKQLRYVNNNLAMTIAGPTYTGYEANGSTYKAPDFNIKNSTYHTVKEAVEAAQTNFFSAKGTSTDANYDNKGATGTNATAAGVRATSAGNFGTALGADATATSEKGTALGYNAKVTEDDGVALGSNSVANTAAGVAGYDVSVADNRANRYTDLTGSVATSTLGAVSVGQSTSVGTETRQITNLAAGKKDTDAVNVAQLRNVNLKIAGNTNDNNGKNDVLLDKQTLTVKGDGTYVTTKANNQTIDVTLTNDTKDKIDNAANKDLSNITNVGKKNITALGTIVEAGHNVTIPAATVDTTTGQKTYTVNAMDTKVSLGTSGLMTLTGGTPDANGVRNYTVDVDPTKVAKTDLSNINNDGKTVIREEAQKAVKVIAGQNTTVTEGTDGTYKTYAVNVAAAGDYRLVENSAAADKAYTVTGNKVDLTVQDGSTPANTKTVTIKDIASKTELDSTKTDLTNKISDTKTELTTKINDTKTELSNKIDDTKTDLINTGLKFNADNNDVKTNKLGSTVTVSGDANITTKITQTGDDSTIAVALNKDLNVKTVTATNTVKAGTTTAGSQTATDNKGGTQTGNFVTGLDNTAWNMADPVFVSGRAATEDQLKTVSDAVRAANAGSSDYRLIENDTATDKAYTVTGNKVDLKVKDDKSGTTNTVTIKDIASKTEFDKLNDRAVKYDVDGSGNVDKSKVTYEGPTYNSTNKSGGTHVTNVAYATGNDGSEAVNVDYLTDKINDSSEALINKGMKFDANVGGVKTNKLGSTVKVQGEGTEADANYSGKNIKTFIGQDSSGNTTIDVKMNKNFEVETVTATGANGKDGKIGINGKDGVTTNLSITRDGQPGVDGAAGTTTTRIVYEKPDGTKEEVATLNDGLKFKGDMGPTSNVKLNKQVDVTGGVTNAADLATGNNIGVTSAAVDANGNAKLQLQLAKDITGLKSVTATDTVKAGTATVGNQTAIDNKGGTQTGNFVTGLDNTNWNMTDPVFVPGRAATEDQLKTVSDAVKAASASASDYRLIENDAATDKAYTVTGNKVDLKVKDDKSGTTKTVTIKDIASKTELDKLDDRAVKYDLDPATNTADKSKVTYEGPTYNSTNKTGGTHVTNVAYATGNDGSEAVNVDYLTDKIKDSSDALINKGLKFDANVGGVQTNKLGSTVTVKGEGTAADANYSGENIKTFIEQDTAGNTTINVKMNKDIIADSIKVNKDGRDGKDGVSITGPTGVAGQDGNNGKVGITGADGKDAVSISGKDGVGHIGLTGPAGTNGKDGSNGIDMTVKNGYDDAAKGVKGEKGVDGVDGITRIVYTDNTGEHQVATMDDGMLYGGDAGNVIKKKLNNQVNVKGGITDETKLTTDDNIGVVSDGTDTLKVRLAKDLKGLNTVTAAETVKAGTATMGNQEATKADGTKETGNYVTGLDNKTWDVDNIVTGRAATEDQLKDALANQSNAGLKFDANVGGTKTNKLGSTVIVKGEGTDADANYSGENIKTFIDQDNTTGTTTINVKLNKNLVADSIKVNKDGKDGKDGVSITGPTGVAGQDGNNGKVGITGADGKDAVSISGKDGVGHIGLTGPAGTNGKDGSNGIDMSVKNGYDDAAKGVKGEKGVDGVDGITRIVYTDNTGEHQVATMDDGMLYGGDTGAVIKKKLNNQVNVKGGITDAAKLSNEDNIGVVADGTDTLMLRLAKDLKGLNSATFNNGTDGNTVVNGGGLTINDAAGNPLTSVTKDGVVITDGPSMTKDGIDASDKKITNVADGTIGAGSKDAVNGGQLHTVVEDLKTKGFGLTAEDGASVKKSLGDTVTVKGDGTNITTSVDNGAVKVALARDLNVDTVTANTVTTGDTKMDTNGVTIKDGANEATKLTKDGLQINDGGNKAVTIDKDGLTIENGPKVTKDGINAGDKKITNVEDGTIAAGSKDAVNGGQLHTAMEDIKAQGFGLKAEDGQSVKKPLGEVIDLKGDGNIKTSVDGTAIKMSLNDTITLGTDPAKQVKVDGSTGTITAGNGANQVTIDGSTGSVTAGNTVKAGDVIMGNQNSGGQNGNFVTGLDNKTWNPNNPVAVTGRAATEDQLKAVNDDFNEKAKNGRVFQGDQAGNDGKVVRGLGDTMNLKGGADVNRLSDNNLAVVKNAAGDGYDIKLAKDLNLKDGSTTYTKTVPGTNTTIPYTVDTKVDGGGITITPSINGQPVPGHTVSLTENGLNNGNNTITNVAPGINGTDAVNVNQLRNAMHSVDGKIADVGAASAAMAGLKPLQYDPLEPTQVLAAVGNYKGSTAAAIGIAHYTNESTMLHMGVSLGGHDNMVNAGVSYKFGTSDAKKAIPARYKAGPISSAYVMQDEVTALKAENLRMKQRDEELSAKYEQVQRDNEEMKAQIAMLMKQAGLTK
jgi:hemagluttinin domain protein